MTLFYRELGNLNGSLLVFLHGGGVSEWMWEKQVQYFNNYHCIIPDLPEHGKSIHSSNFTIKDSAIQLNKLIEQKANGKEIIVVGFSLGAQITIQMLAERPDLIDYAMINSALVRPMNISKKIISPTIKLTYPLTKVRLFSKIQAKTLYIDDEFFEQYYKDTCQMNANSLIRILKENMAFSIPDNFARAQAKILITVGQKEKSIMKKSAKDLVEFNQKSIGIIIPNIGHGISLANPEFFNKLLENWISKNEIPIDLRIV